MRVQIYVNRVVPTENRCQGEKRHGKVLPEWKSVSAFDNLLIARAHLLLCKVVIQ
jgi:hypothetical protein